MEDQSISSDDRITTAQAQDILGISRRAVRNAINRGRIVGHKIGEGKGGLWIVSRKSVLEYKQSRRGGGRALDTGEETKT